MIKDLYSLDELISKMEEIKEKGEGHFNFPKAILTLAKEIQQLKKTTTDQSAEKRVCY